MLQEHITWEYVHPYSMYEVTTAGHLWWILWPDTFSSVLVTSCSYFTMICSVRVCTTSLLRSSYYLPLLCCLYLYPSLISTLLPCHLTIVGTDQASQPNLPLAQILPFLWSQASSAVTFLRIGLCSWSARTYSEEVLSTWNFSLPWTSTCFDSNFQTHPDYGEHTWCKKSLINC